jgi:DNA-binding IclR family transcriptional regulator
MDAGATQVGIFSKQVWVLSGERHHGVLQGLNVSYIGKQPGHGPVTSFTPAATLPVHPTAVGRALLAFAPPGTVESVILRGLRPYTTRIITSPARFRRALAVTRLPRVALTRGELKTGVGGVAMPVLGPGGDVVAAIELIVAELDHDLYPFIGPLAIACRNLTPGTRRRPTPTHEACQHWIREPAVCVGKLMADLW